MIWSQLESAVHWTLGAIFGVLIVATIVVWGLGRRYPQRNWTELRQRVNTWWIIAAIFTAAIVVNRTLSIVFFAVVSFLALREYLSLVPIRQADRRVLLWAYLTIPLQYCWVYMEWYGMFIIFIPVFAFLLLPLRMIASGETEGYIRANGTLHWGMMLMVFCLSHAAFLLVLKLKDDPARLPGPGMVLFLVVFTQLNDVLQYIWGKSLGRRKIVPAVSPGKTWGGFLGGLTSTTALAALAGPFLTPMNHWQSLLGGAIIAAGGFVGDVNISALKRDLKIKDSGTLLPGHGGILDRIDSLIYTAPLFFHYIYYLFQFQTFGYSPGRIP